MNCTKIECSKVPLTCPLEQQINDTETCCQICKGEDYKHKTNIDAVKPRIVGKHRTLSHLPRNLKSSSSDLKPSLEPPNIGR